MYFGVRELTFIGDKLTNHGVKPDPEKTAAIEDMKKPENKKDIQRFLGMINYLARYLPDLSERTAPIRKLLEKDVHWQWTHEHEKSFRELKDLIVSDLILCYYDPHKPIKISADASLYGLGAVLLQKQEDNEWRPVAYGSRSLTKNEIRYAQIEKEALAMAYACQHFHQYIYGQTIGVETDHKPLVSIFAKPLNDCPARIQRIRFRLQKYDLKVEYVPGKYMYTADALSRASRSTTEENYKPAIDECIEHHVHAIHKDETSR